MKHFLKSFVPKFLTMSLTYFAPSIFVNHGGGPFPVMGEKYNVEIAQSLRDVRNYLNFDLLTAIIVVTAHWEATDCVSISSGEKHELMYDYTNFPPVTYTYKYGAPGAPDLARKVHEALSKANITSKLDPKRPWDHGVFIPMMLIRPEEDIPVLQVSILKNHDAKQHYELGKVLYQFRKEGAAVIGSGLSYHNMKRLNEAEESNDGVLEGVIFDKFLNEVCLGDEVTREGIVKWKEVPEALMSHPEGEADHLMPLVVAAGAAGPSKGRKVFESNFYNTFPLSGFVWD